MTEESEMNERAPELEQGPVSAPRRRPMRLKSLVAVILCMAALIAVGTTLASVAAQKQADNVLTFGNISISLLETMKTDQGAEVEVPDDYTERLSDTAASRIVRVQNVGTHPCWVRVGFKLTAVTDRGEVDASVAMQLDEKSGNDATTDNTWVYKIDSDTGIGWFYYTTPLDDYSGVPAQPGSSPADDLTNVLLESISIDPDAVTGLPDGATVSEYRFDILAQAVQSEHNDTDEETIESVLDVQGWPEVEGAAGASFDAADSTTGNTEEVGA